MDRGLPGGHGVYVIKGAVAGVVSTLTFAAVHAAFISDIWYSAAPMSVAGAICGASVAGSFRVLRDRPSLRGWLLYNATFVSVFVLLGTASMLLYEPVTTIPELVAADGPPTHLFGTVTPLLAAFTLASAALITFAFGRNWPHFGPVVLTLALLMLVLGPNVAIMGLIEIPGSSAYVVATFFGLIFVIVLAYALAFVALPPWRRSSHQRRSDAPRVQETV